MRIHEAWTQLPPAAVIERARRYFGSQNSPKSAFVQEAGENHLRLHLDMGEIVLGVSAAGVYGELAWAEGIDIDLPCDCDGGTGASAGGGASVALRAIRQAGT